MRDSRGNRERWYVRSGEIEVTQGDVLAQVRAREAGKVVRGLHATRRFVAHLRDLSSNGLRAFADTLSVDVDTLRAANAVFELEMVEDPLVLFEIFSKTTLPRDSTVVVVTPEF